MAGAVRAPPCSFSSSLLTPDVHGEGPRLGLQPENRGHGLPVYKAWPLSPGDPFLGSCVELQTPPPPPSGLIMCGMNHM